MPVSQTEIYYLIGETREVLEQSPYLEAFKAKDQEVLLLTDPVDEFMVQPFASTRARSSRPSIRVNWSKPRLPKRRRKLLSHS